MLGHIRQSHTGVYPRMGWNAMSALVGFFPGVKALKAVTPVFADTSQWPVSAMLDTMTQVSVLCLGTCIRTIKCRAKASKNGTQTAAFSRALPGQLCSIADLAGSDNCNGYLQIPRGHSHNCRSPTLSEACGGPFYCPACSR